MPKTPRAPVRFRERELLRAARVAKDVGGEVVVDPSTGKFTIVPTNPGESKQGDDVENWLSKQQQKGP